MNTSILTGLLLVASNAVLLAESSPPGLVALTVAPGFEAEPVLAAEPGDGSWSAMTVDPRGRLVISPQGREPMLRVTLPDDGTPARVEKLAVPVTSAMGLLFAFDSLYVHGAGPEGLGLYRLRDTKGVDAYDEVKLLRRSEGKVNGEHGSHGLVLGPDQRIYLVQGNHVLPPRDASPRSPFKNYGEDQLLPSANYGVSGGDKCKAPAGLVLRLDADGGNVELFAGGFRNVYDLAFDARGELFAFDSDTEYSYGLPWYVPTRILHVVSGGEYGFREGTGKSPAYYADSLPPVVNVGPGSPTGVKFGTTSAFPERYRRALFALDWTFGRILAVHLEACGASVSGRFETFLQGRPLNVTDIEFGRDGAMYFVTGGRNTCSALYRVRYTGGEGKDAVSTAVSPEVAARRAIESLHGIADAQTIPKVWPALGSDDRFLRYAARVALESQSVTQWSGRALSEQNPRTAMTALLALARIGDRQDRAAVVGRVAQWWPLLHDEDLQLEALRSAALALARHGLPYPETTDELRGVLDAAYPAKSQALNRELSQLLIALGAPGIVPRTLALVQQAATLEEQLFFIFHLRHVHEGWSAADRETYFRWFLQPQRVHPPEVTRWFTDLRLHYTDGASFPVYLANIRREAAATLDVTERREFAALIDAPLPSVGKPVETKPRKLVHEWTSTELRPIVEKLARPRSAERGREVFAAANCVACHRYANEGGATGPDLTAVSYKLGAREMLESLIEPSKVVSDQFQNTIVELASGLTRVGRIVERGKEKIVIATDPLADNREEILKSQIETMRPSPISPMPAGLLNTLTSDEILDLLAYLGFGAP
jgi:putative heme-binding domain-containing protein